MEPSPNSLLAFDEYGVFDLQDWSLELCWERAALIAGGNNSTCTGNIVCAGGVRNANAVCGGYGVTFGSTNQICGDNAGCLSGGSGPSTNGLCS